MAYTPVPQERVGVPDSPLKNPLQLLAPQRVQELKREDVRFAAPYNPYEVFAEATRQLVNPNPASVLYR